jgi:heme/copper-type cytochrome/quinol oxidase subunit 2
MERIENYFFVYCILFLFVLLLVMLILFLLSFFKSQNTVNIYKYKIRSLIFCWVLVIIYVIIFFILLYGLRILNLGNATDLSILSYFLYWFLYAFINIL